MVKADGAPKLTFSSSAVYNSFFEQSPIVPWHPLVWIKKGIPKHNSLAWLMLLNRSPTRDRLLAWGLQTDSSCVFYVFSSAIWTYHATRLQIIQTTNSWDDVAPVQSTKSIFQFSPGKQQSMKCGGKEMKDFTEGNLEQWT
ncbi:hypothetical protein DY000_02005360 [Brassica cretica]|uniref:Reverse transcriptase zinc-binding domain-containing protein n=1 Tax=Brassica cretica TaxID=69181 RepID=A0ABQ7BSX4_BRACR|nr:hypothetical protein DY000_02005360 [Brassica cretica]